MLECMYPLTLTLIEFLTSAPAAYALQKLQQRDLRAALTLERVTELRKTFTTAQAAVLLDQARLRHKASGKFPNARHMWFVDEALQQASSRAVARYRAQRFASYTCVADLGCGIGADTLALAEVVPHVIAVELDPVRARLTKLNVAACGLADRVRVLCADWTKLNALKLSPRPHAAFVDPARRVAGRRVFRLNAMQPPIAAILELQRHITTIAVKVAPGVQDDEIPAPAEVEFISERGALKEAVLWFGDLRQGVARAATLLPGALHLHSASAEVATPIRQPGRYLYEPDPAIIRATLVRTLAAHLGAAQIDARIAYLTSDILVKTPFARVWHIIRHGHFNLKTLNHWLRDYGTGCVIVKKRGSPIDPDTFRRRLKTTAGGPEVTVFLTRVQEKPWMILTEHTRFPVFSGKPGIGCTRQARHAA